MKKLIAILLVFVLAISLLGCSTQQVQQETALNYDQAVEKLNAYLSSGTVKSQAVTHMADPSWVGNEDAASELPEIDKYPLSISGSGQINVEIFSSTEKSSAKTPGWLDIQAQAFNAQHNQINGQTVSVSIRPIASGLAFDYIRTQTHVPDAYTPANNLWGLMIESSGVQLQTVADRLTGNTAGILMEKSTYDNYIKKYGSVTIENVVNAVLAGDIILGHTDPNVSSTGLNIYVQELRSFDPANPFSDKALSALRQFEALIPPASPTTAEMAKVAQKGILNAVIMESQAFAAYPELSNWVFSPCGVRHDSPLYALGSLSSDKQQVLQMFSDFCVSPEAQTSASSVGFNQYNDYTGVDNQYTGTELLSALKVWKDNKDGGMPVISVFIVDRSGSMDGSKLTRVKDALKNSMQYVNESNYIGLVSYSSASDVTLDLPIGQFNAKQQSLFAGAVNDFKAAGGTATNSALTVALDLALKQQASIPDAKIRILILSDGQQNEGLTLYEVKGLVNGLGIPVYGIGFEATLTDLQELADINEGYCVNADSEDVIYKLKSLFVAQL